MMAGDLEEAEKAFFLGIRQVRYRALEVCNLHIRCVFTSSVP